MKFIDTNKLIGILELINIESLDINDLNGILEMYGDTYYVENGEWALCEEGKKLEANPKIVLHGNEIMVSISGGAFLQIGSEEIKIISNKEELPQWAQELTTGNVSEMRKIK